MSINITHDIEVIADAVLVETAVSGDTVSASDHEIVIETPDENAVTGIKKEYSIIGDGLYASIAAEEAPTWLTSIVDSVVDNRIASGFVDYNNLVADVRSAIDSIDLASNNYVTKVQYDIDQSGIVNSVVNQLNATYGLTGIQSTITNISAVIANELQTQGITIANLESSYKGYTDSQITTLDTTLSSAIGSYAASVNALTVAYEDETTGLVATANAVDSLQTYVGIDSNGDPTSLGLLADVALLKKQTDGSVDIYAGTHDVVTGTDTGTPDDDSMVLAEWPYAMWVPMSGTIDPVATTRTVLKSGVSTALPIETNTVYHNTVLNTYWLFDATTSSWSAINATQYSNYATTVRDAHKGDSYIKYSVDANGVKSYIAAFKFVLTAIDATSPYSTDTEGYAWIKVVDNDAQAAYMAALNAYALADGKVAVYFALQATVNPGDATYAYYYHPTPTDGTNLRKTSDNSVVTPDEGDQVTVKAIDGDAEDLYIYFFKGGVWAVGTPAGLVAGAKWTKELDAYLGGKDGGGSWGGTSTLVNKVETTSKGEIHAAFSYDSQLTSKTGQYYKSGFGLNTTTTGGDGSVGNPFTSEFWIDAERLVLKSPTYGVSATFDVGPSGLVLGLAHTEATRNVPRGAWNSGTAYVVGDIVTSGGSSYVALQASTNVAVTNTSYWELLAAQGVSGQSVDYWFKRATSTPVDAPASNGSDANGWYTDLGNAALSTSGDLYTIKGTTADGVTWSYGSPALSNKRYIKEVVIYSDATTGTATKPADGQSTFNFGTNTLTINNAAWNLSPPSLTANSQKVYVSTALVQGNETDTAVGIVWSTPSIYAQRQDGTQGTAGDKYKEVFLYQNAATPPAKPTNTQGFNTTSGVAAATGSWVTTYSAPTGSDNAYRINITIVQTAGTGNWAAVDASWTGPVQATGTNADVYKEIHLYTNSATTPTVPAVAGSFNTTTGASQATGVWTTSASAPPANEFTWRTSLTVKQPNGAGAWTNADTVWNPPVKMTGEKGSTGQTGSTGARGTAAFTASYNNAVYNVAAPSLSSAQVAALWDGVTSPTYATEIAGDTLIVTNTSADANGGTHIYEYTGSAWTAANTFTVNGNQVVTGTLSAAAIGTGSLVSTAFTAGQPLFSIDMNGGAVFRGIEIRDSSNNLLMASGSAMDYSKLGGTKPPSNADVTNDNLAGTGVNHIPGPYSDFKSLPVVSAVTGGSVAYQASSLRSGATGRLALTASTNDAYFYLGASSTDYNINISPNKKWIVSCWVAANGASTPVEIYIKAGDGTHYSKSFTVGTGPTRVSAVFDLSTNSSTTCVLRLDCNLAGRTAYFDGLMLEAQVGTLTTPSAYNIGLPQITASTASTYIADASIDTLRIAGEAVTATRSFGTPAYYPYLYNGDYVTRDIVLINEGSVYFPHSITYLFFYSFIVVGSFSSGDGIGIEVQVDGTMYHFNQVTGQAAAAFKSAWFSLPVTAGFHSVTVKAGIKCSLVGGTRGFNSDNLAIFGAVR